MENTEFNAAKMIEILKTAYGQNHGICPLLDAGWDSLHEDFIAPKREYTEGRGNDRCWPEGFSELLDGRIVYRGHYGNILLAPVEFQPIDYLRYDAKKIAYDEAMSK